MRNKETPIKTLLKERVKKLSLSIIEFSRSLPKNDVTGIISRQVIRSGTSIGANYFSACRARSKAEFISRMGIVEEEADETLYWIEILVESGIVKEETIADLKNELNEIISIAVTSIRTARKNMNKNK
ncbi:MAG: four helix bundle protein [Deltaproteobacteria bacterium]|nr:MAG: four helix bundle protein [Deltaproteobacteria bacterium]